MRLFYEDELRRKSFYEMYQIAIDEKLIENYITNPTREEIINIILKYNFFPVMPKQDLSFQAS